MVWKVAHSHILETGTQKKRIGVQPCEMTMIKQW